MRRTIMILLMSLLLVACGNSVELTATLIEKTVTNCDLQKSEYVKVTDNGHSLVLEGGEELYPNSSYTTYVNGLDIDDFACVMKSLAVPGYIISQMEKTSAMDGIQKDQYTTSDNRAMRVSWTFDPKNGLDVSFYEE